MFKTILATGGPGMVKAAYSSGKPAIGVGPGNGPHILKRPPIFQNPFTILFSPRLLIMV